MLGERSNDDAIRLSGILAFCRHHGGRRRHAAAASRINPRPHGCVGLIDAAVHATACSRWWRWPNAASSMPESGSQPHWGFVVAAALFAGDLDAAAICRPWPVPLGGGHPSGGTLLTLSWLVPRWRRHGRGGVEAVACSPDGAKRNPGKPAQAIVPDFALLHPGYRIDSEACATSTNQIEPAPPADHETRFMTDAPVYQSARSGPHPVRGAAAHAAICRGNHRHQIWRPCHGRRTPRQGVRA